MNEESSNSEIYMYPVSIFILQNGADNGCLRYKAISDQTLLLKNMSIQVKLVNAVLSHDTEFFSNMDPYCILSLGRQKYRSKTKSEAGKRPVWNQTFNFSGEDNILKVVVMDQDTVSDDLVGEGSVDLSRFKGNSTEQQEFVQLYYKGKAAGRVQLAVKGGTGGMNNNNFGGGNNIMGGIYQGFNSNPNSQWGQGGQGSNQWGGQGSNQWGQGQGMQGNQWGQGGQGMQGMQGNQWGQGQGMQGNQWGQGGNMGPPPQPLPSQWGDLSQNNGGGNSGGSNPYPSLDSGPNPLQMLGAAFGQQGGTGSGNNMNQGQGLANNPQAQYNMINGMGMLGGLNQNQGVNPYGTNPYK